VICQDGRSRDPGNDEQKNGGGGDGNAGHGGRLGEAARKGKRCPDAGCLYTRIVT
jgi:hypothetical protein